MSTMVPGPTDAGRQPQEVQAGLWLFAPSRDSQGGSAWWLELEAGGAGGGVLIDCPGYTEANLAFLQGRAAGRIVLTSREGHGRCRRFQEALDWPVLLQEQEAYLLPGVQRVDTFAEQHQLSEQLRLLWTPGPTPGACVLLASRVAGDVLFCGRLLSPTAPGQAAPLRTARSFHWHRWLRSLGQLRAWLPAGSPDWLASGAGLGALRGDKLIADARALLDGLDLEALARSAAG
jgi:glyoxylase-like metal-dependent hydrolase (beta-lactamase superfamily II)